jgi:prepilin-type N-terminal cleavage/methylation domain-containing protein
MHFITSGRKNHSSGFTLLELLVVIAIIGIFSSIILVNINLNRKKARDGAIKTQLKQFQNILALEYNDTGSYANLQTDVWSPETPCNTAFAGNYATQATQICNEITKLAGSWGVWGAPYKLYAGNAIDPATKYSIMVPLNSKNTFYCIGSSGSSDTETAGSGSFSATGCYDNP